MTSLPSPAVKTTDHPLPPHPSQYMTPERFAEWCAVLEEAAAARGLPPDPWPL